MKKKNISKRILDLCMSVGHQKQQADGHTQVKNALADIFLFHGAHLLQIQSIFKNIQTQTSKPGFNITLRSA